MGSAIASLPEPHICLSAWQEIPEMKSQGWENVDAPSFDDSSLVQEYNKFRQPASGLFAFPLLSPQRPGPTAEQSIEQGVHIIST